MRTTTCSPYCVLLFSFLAGHTTAITRNLHALLRDTIPSSYLSIGVPCQSNVPARFESVVAVLLVLKICRNDCVGHLTLVSPLLSSLATVVWMNKGWGDRGLGGSWERGLLSDCVESFRRDKCKALVPLN